jgi:hypothetical protein
MPSTSPSVFGYCSPAVVAVDTDSQAAQIADYAKEKFPGYGFRGCFTDQVMQSHQIWCDRPAGLCIIGTAKKGDHILCTDLVCMFRNATDIIRLLDILYLSNVCCTSINDQIALGGKYPETYHALNVLKISQQVTSQIEEGRKTIRHKKAEKKEGMRTAKCYTTAPIGFLSSCAHKGRLPRNESEIALVEQAIKWLQQGFTKSEVVRHLRENELYNPRTGAPIDRNYARAIANTALAIKESRRKIYEGRASLEDFGPEITQLLGI